MDAPPVGKTKDAGWQVGVSRTIAADLATAWEFLISPTGLGVWLGSGIEVPLVRGQRYETDDGTTGEVRSVREGDRVRLTWQPPGRADPATVQVALVAAKSGCTFRFHAEHLYDAEERVAMRERFRGVVDLIEAELCG